MASPVRVGWGSCVTCSRSRDISGAVYGITIFHVYALDRYKSSAGQRASPHTPLRGSAAASAGVRQDDDAIIIVPVSRTAAACDAQVDYYNATGGRWEPLLERVVAQGDREIVTRRPAPVLAESGAGIDLGGGVEADDGEAISDGWGQAQGETCSVVRLSCFEEDVKVRGGLAIVGTKLEANPHVVQFTALASA